MFLKKLIKKFLIKHFDFVYYGAYHNQIKFIEILKSYSLCDFMDIINFKLKVFILYK